MMMNRPLSTLYPDARVRQTKDSFYTIQIADCDLRVCLFPKGATGIEFAAFLEKAAHRIIRCEMRLWGFNRIVKIPDNSAVEVTKKFITIYVVPGITIHRHRYIIRA